MVSLVTRYLSLGSCGIHYNVEYQKARPKGRYGPRRVGLAQGEIELSPRRKGRAKRERSPNPKKENSNSNWNLNSKISRRFETQT